MRDDCISGRESKVFELRLAGEQEETSFDRGVKRYTWLMIRFMLVMVPLVFVINGLTKHNWHDAFFFSMAVAVGLTPEMLPMIVSVCLSKGAMAMSRKKVIVKRLNAIQNFGAMDVFCTDKTGTLTMDHIILELHCNIHKEESEEVLREAYVISHFQSGLKNVLDRAVLKYTELHKELSLEKYAKVDEIPFDFSRRIMSVVVDGPDGERQLLTKGAPEAVFKKCAHFEYEGEIFPMEPILVGDLLEERNELNSDGFRVLAVAKKKIPLGNEVEKMSDDELSEFVDRFNVFARLSPAHKQRIVKALQKSGHTVGFMGDGINDAPALRAADVGVSVDNAVDIAKESADVILLEKSLMVLEQGVLEGRKVFVNILKYIRMGASSNFGNMFSVIGASAWLPFVPMAPIQVLTNNLLYDFSQVPIPTDNIGPQQIAKPRPWHIGEIAKFIVCIGPISSVFDYTTYGMMWFIFKCNDLNLVPPTELAARFPINTGTEQTYAAALFHTGWFVESLMTQTLIIHVIRTNLIPFIQSRASWQLTMTTIIIMGFAAYLPYSPIATHLGFVPLPPLYWPLLLLTLICYVGLTQVIRTWLIRKAWV